MNLSNTYIDPDSDIWFIPFNGVLFFKVKSGIYKSRSRRIDNIHALVLRHTLTKLTKG